MVTIEQLKTTLKSFQPKKLPDDGSKRGAVLIPIYNKENSLYILFTKRTDELPTHKGQISFPGGKIEDKDNSLLDCALRETNEEIGLQPNTFTIIGELNQSKTNGSNILLSAFVGELKYPFKLKINKNEVKEIIEVPFNSFLEENRWERMHFSIDGIEVDTWYFHYKKQLIWGATAKIVRQLIDLLQ